MLGLGFNVEKLRKDFPILSKVTYFDNACMSLKPKQVIDKINEYYMEYAGCGGRSLHKISSRVSLEVDMARKEVKNLINAGNVKEIVFTKNATEAINLVSNILDLKEGDEVIVSDKEHNSNLIPWLKLKKERGVVVKEVESNRDGTFNIDNLKKTLSEKTKLVSIVHVSNLDGVENPIKEIVKITHEKGALVLVDGAQSVPHMEVDVKDLKVDFLAFSGHKMLGPTGTGVLYGKREILEKAPQFLVGGQTVIDSSIEGYEPEELPMKYEAGLQNYAGIIGLGEACKYLNKVGYKNIQKQELKLNKIISEGLADEEKIELIGPKAPEKRGGIFSFNVRGMDPHHVAKMLDASKGVAVRSGAHCVHSWFNKHKMKGSVRASVYFYNTEDEAKMFVSEMKKIVGLAG